MNLPYSEFTGDEFTEHIELLYKRDMSFSIKLETFFSNSYNMII